MLHHLRLIRISPVCKCHGRQLALLGGLLKQFVEFESDECCLLRHFLPGIDLNQGSLIRRHTLQYASGAAKSIMRTREFICTSIWQRDQSDAFLSAANLQRIQYSNGIRETVNWTVDFGHAPKPFVDLFGFAARDSQSECQPCCSQSRHGKRLTRSAPILASRNIKGAPHRSHSAKSSRPRRPISRASRYMGQRGCEDKAKSKASAHQQTVMRIDVWSFFINISHRIPLILRGILA
jgi:hypothetical protein